MKEKSDFITRYGLNEFNLMLFGMKISPATFIRLMDNVLKCVDHAVSYFDDIVFDSDTRVEHLSHVEIVIKKIYMDVNLTNVNVYQSADQIVSWVT